MTGKIKQKITADYVLDLYIQSKICKGKDALTLFNAACTLSQHLNEWLVIPEEISKLKRKH